MRKLRFALVTSLALILELVLSPAVAAPSTCADLLAGQTFLCRLSDGSEPFFMFFNPDFSGAPTALFGNQPMLCGCLSTGTLAKPHPGTSKSFVCGHVPGTYLAVLLSARVNSTGARITGSTVGDPRSLNYLVRDLVTCTRQ